MGNNGGDGLVISRLLLEKGFQVTTYLVCFSENRSEDFRINLKRLSEMKAVIKEIRQVSDFPLIEHKDIVIDAIFGIGLKRAPIDFTKEFIKHINSSCSTVIAIDIPSGLFAQSAVQDKDAVIKSKYTLSFQSPKLAFLLSDHQPYIEKWNILDIELDKDYLENVETNYNYIDRDYVSNFIIKRQRFSQKNVPQNLQAISHDSFGRSPSSLNESLMTACTFLTITIEVKSAVTHRSADTPLEKT